MSLKLMHRCAKTQEDQNDRSGERGDYAIAIDDACTVALATSLLAQQPVNAQRSTLLFLNASAGTLPAGG
jgi:hypothetical protein